MANWGRANLGLISILVAVVGASALGACSDEDGLLSPSGGGNAGGKSGSGGKAGGGSAGEAGDTMGGSSGEAGSAPVAGAPSGGEPSAGAPGGGAPGGGAPAGGAPGGGAPSGGAPAGGGGTTGGAGGKAGGGGKGGAAGEAGSSEAGSGGEQAGSGGEGGEPPCAPALAKPTGVPTEIQVNDAATLVAVYAATGVQTYTCAATIVGATTTYAWAGAPTATLYDQACTLSGTHYVGPHWKANDGSIVKGTLVRSTDSATPNSIKQLLLSAASDPLDPGLVGIFTPVTAVQRLNTVNGLAPTTACTAVNVDAVFVSPYSATYYFYSGTDIIPTL